MYLLISLFARVQWNVAEWSGADAGPAVAVCEYAGTIDWRPWFQRPVTGAPRLTMAGSLAAALTSQLSSCWTAGWSRFPDGWPYMGLVFTTSKGTPISPRNLNRQFNGLIKKYKLPLLTVHGLRHSAATRMLEDGVDIKTAEDILGHADASMLLNVYSHVTPGMRKQAAESMESLL